ncbi:MAG: dethiobiotin synthase [Candidatus Coatesbacteria bacterium]
MRPEGLAVLGTGTGVGKTVVTAALGMALRAGGCPFAVWKPVSTGGVRRGRRYVSGDAIWLRRVLGLPEPVEEIGTVCLRLPLAPAVAGRLERTPVDLGALRRRWSALGASGRFVLVEGVGGALVPLRGRVAVADFVAGLNLPAIVVGTAGLGTINHTLLTLEAVRARGIRVAGVVLNGARGRDPSERTNPGAIAALGRTRVIAVLPWLAGVRTDRSPLRRLARRLPAREILRAGRRVR